MELIELKGLIAMDTGAPMPIVISSDSKTAVSFNKQTEHNFDDLIKQNTLYDDYAYSIIFSGCVYHKFGLPGDETIYGHPYSKLGLRSYAFYELKNSDLINDLIKIASVHPRFDKKRWTEYSHYILTFHDDMFECVARNFEIREVKKSVQKQSIALLDELH